MADAYSNARWLELAARVIGIGYYEDLAYYYLARSAEELGERAAARDYYLQAMDARSKRRCDALVDMCDGHRFPDDIISGIKRLGSAKEAEDAAKLTALREAEDDRVAAARQAESEKRREAEAAAAQAASARKAESERREIAALDEQRAREAARLKEEKARCDRDLIALPIFKIAEGDRTAAKSNLLFQVMMAMNTEIAAAEAAKWLDAAIETAARMKPVELPASCRNGVIKAEDANALKDFEGLRKSFAGLRETLEVPDVLLDYNELNGSLKKVKGYYAAIGELEYLYLKPGSLTFLMVDTKQLPRESRKRLLTECSRGCPIVVVGYIGPVMYNKGLTARILK